MFMKYWLTSLSIFAFVLACGGAASEPQSTAEAKPDGEKIYKIYCVACHGLYGDMGASGAYNLQDSKLSLEEATQVILKGRNAMTAFESLLKEDEIKAVAKYVMKLRKQQ
jgi:mono/diheme cytochrome c family protein